MLAPKAPLEKFRVRHKKWISEDDTTGDPSGRQDVEPLRLGASEHYKVFELSKKCLKLSRPKCLANF